MRRFCPRASASGALTASAIFLANQDSRNDVVFAAHAVRRSSTVAVALTQCVLDYRRTLNRQYPNSDARESALSACHARCALITRTAIEQNAGIFIKLGQHISALTYIFPPEWTSAMLPLLDQCPQSSFESIEQMVLKDTGHPLEEHFATFDKQPVAAASLAQVHIATLKETGQEVAVKVQHPSLQQYVPLDLELTETIFRMVDYLFPEYPMTWLADEMRRSIFVELDFREEARNADKTRDFFASRFNETALRVPKVFWALNRIMCMERLPGVRPDHVAELQQLGIPLKSVSRCLAHIFNAMIFCEGAGLHCDPHAGNLAIRKTNNKHGFEIVLYDHGLYRYVPHAMQHAYAQFWLALLNGDRKTMKKAAHDFAGINESNFAIFAAAITGRDYDEAVNGSVLKRKRSHKEIECMQQHLKEDKHLTAQIIQMLREMPPTVLLILKTNDLVRVLDEKLGYPLGITRQFAIMGTYCANTYFRDLRENSTSKREWFGIVMRYWFIRIKLFLLPILA